MAAAGVRVTGLREVIRSLERYGVEVSDLKKSFRRIGTLVTDEAKDLAPSLSGALAGSIRPSNSKNKALVRAGGARVPYAGVLHYGGGVPAGQPGPHNIRPHPFLTDAVDRKRNDVVRTLDAELNELIRSLDLN